MEKCRSIFLWIECEGYFSNTRYRPSAGAKYPEYEPSGLCEGCISLSDGEALRDCFLGASYHLLYFVPTTQVSSLVDGHETLQRIRPDNGFPSDLEYRELAPVHQSTHGVSSDPGHFCRFFNSHYRFLQRSYFLSPFNGSHPATMASIVYAICYHLSTRFATY